MLTYKFDHDTKVLEVAESLLSFTQTTTSYWYFNIFNWTQSSTGKKGSPLNQRMTIESIRWVKKHYLPKVGVGPEQYPHLKGPEA